MSSESPAGAQLTATAGFHLVTADLPRLRRFYQETLGFAADGAEQAIARDELELLGLHGAGRRQALRLGEQVVAIDQFDTMGRAYPEHGDPASLWFQHLAVVAADMGEAYRRLMAATPISEGVRSSFRHRRVRCTRSSSATPMATRWSSCDSRPAWQGKTPAAGQIGYGIDHSAISDADADASSVFYRSLGLEPSDRTLSQGPEQQRLDHLGGVEVSVVPMQPPSGTPHLELLGYRVPRGAAGPPLQANDVAATRIVWQGARAVLLRDPDGHIHQIASSTGASVWAEIPPCCRAGCCGARARGCTTRRAGRFDGNAAGGHHQSVLAVIDTVHHQPGRDQRRKVKPSRHGCSCREHHARSP